MIPFDPHLDVRKDATGPDPDSSSLALRGAHVLLWSKPLPDGTKWEVVDGGAGGYLVGRTAVSSMELSSDSIIHSYSYWSTMKHVIDAVPAEVVADFVDRAHQVGGYILFPRDRRGGSNINSARSHPRGKIADRFDLTLECIRLHYLGEWSPLQDALSRYSDFFDLFRDFDGYVAFWLLDDLVNADRESVKFFLPFDGFASPGVPHSPDAYIAYSEQASDFVGRRGQRMVDSLSRRYPTGLSRAGSRSSIGITAERKQAWGVAVYLQGHSCYLERFPVPHRSYVG